MITSSELTEVMQSLGMDTTTRKAQDMITKVDLDGESRAAPPGGSRGRLRFPPETRRDAANFRLSRMNIRHVRCGRAFRARRSFYPLGSDGRVLMNLSSSQSPCSFPSPPPPRSPLPRGHVLSVAASLRRKRLHRLRRVQPDDAAARQPRFHLPPRQARGGGGAQAGLQVSTDREY